MEQLTSAEMATLWSCYLGDTMAICVLKYFLNHVDDVDTRAVMDHALQLSQGHIQTVTKIFNQEKSAIPVGFTEADVNLTAPRLFSDTIYLHYLDGMTKLGMVTYTAAYASSARRDIREFFGACLTECEALINKCENALIAKGFFMRPPSISMPKKAEFVQKRNFMAGFLGERRVLNALEITNLYLNIQRATLSKALIIGFAQTAQSKSVRQHMERGRDIQKKHIKIFTDMLMNDDLPAPPTLDAEVTDSTTQTFSDKLMMFHLGSLTATAIGNYGVAIGACLRRDLAVMYTRLMGEVELYHEDGAEIAIDNSWMEEPPMADNRKELARQK